MYQYRRNLKYFVFIICMLFLSSFRAFAEENKSTESSNNSSSPAHPQSVPYEIGLQSGFLLSQQFAKNFFADFDSDIKPLPATVLTLIFAQQFSDYFITYMLAIPTLQEVVKIKNQNDWVYYYPKSFILGTEKNIFSDNLHGLTNLELRLGFGINSPISHRFMQVIYPLVSFRPRISLSSNSVITLGVVYLGNIKNGLWSMPFGFGYKF